MSALGKYVTPGLALPIGILAIIMLMVMPIPVALLDIFFVLNIALSIAVLMAAMNAKKPLDFSSFPSVLLFATLLRLALNVASTRIVLMKGHEGEAAAGKVIEAFGAFLIGGNFAVGIFVFLILIIINLVVVTKGAGRVSEVSARFTLDALPGKQMAIDSDLAAGLISADEAKSKRREIATEADFYGSMDGASKFVKGDAIAALLILGVNIIAGLVLGMVTHSMSAGEAGERYVTLAVGDALVASVPSLLLSIAAAVIVTRVADSRDLAGQIGGQLGQAGTWLPVGVILIVMGLIPAMPQSVFLPLGALAIFLWRHLRQREAAEAAPVIVQEEPRDPATVAIEDISEDALVTVELGYALVHYADEARGAPLVSRLTGLRRQLCETFGFIVPQFRIRDSFDLPPSRYRVRLGGSVLGGGTINEGRLLAIDTGDVPPVHSIRGEATTDPTFGCPALWIAQSARENAIAEGFLVVDPHSVIATHVNNLLATRADKLFGPDQARQLLDNLETRHAQLIETITPQPLSLGVLTRLLKALLADGISLAYPVPVLSAIAQAALQTTDHDMMVDLVRAELGSQIVSQICAPDEELPVITLSAQLEEMVAGNMQDQGAGHVVEPQLARMIGEHIAAVISGRKPGMTSPALIAQPALRRPLADLLKVRAPECVVLSIAELPPTQPISVIAVIGEEEQAAPSSAASPGAAESAPTAPPAPAMSMADGFGTTLQAEFEKEAVFT